MNIITLSPKGQVTIPRKEREGLPSNKFILERQGLNIVLKPVKIEALEADDFHELSIPSLEAVWNNTSDDIYGEFYNNKTCQ